MNERVYNKYNFQRLMALQGHERMKGIIDARNGKCPLCGNHMGSEMVVVFDPYCYISHLHWCDSCGIGVEYARSSESKHPVNRFSYPFRPMHKQTRRVAA